VGDLVAVFRERHNFRPGQAIRLAPRTVAAHLFDEASGDRIG
jgi:multiple sugar transport system ATP-binding protein